MTISLLLYKKLRDNKELILKNYYYRKAIKDYIKETHDNDDNQYRIFSKIKENKELVPEVNKKAYETQSENNLIFKNIIILFNEMDLKNIDVLICYTEKIQLDKMRADKRDNLLNNYKDIFDKIYPNITNKKNKCIKEFNELLIKIAKDNPVNCKSLTTIKVPISKIIKKLKNRNMSFGRYDKDFFYIIYNDIIYYVKPHKNKKDIYICINNTFTKDNINWFVEFIEEEYSPIFDASIDSKNLPEPTFVKTELSRRKSITKLSGITYNKEPKKLGSYTPKQYFDSENPYDTGSIQWGIKDKHLKYQIREVMQCFRNDRKSDDGPIRFNATDANYRREPFIKQVLNFPPNYRYVPGNKGGKISKCDLELVKKIRFELNNILDLIKIKYPPKKNKEYFLIDLAGGANKHFDYSLYSFTEDELNEPQDTFLVKKNLWKKLEFKTNGKAKNIFGLSKYLEKAPLMLFDTINNTFGKEFIKMTQNITLHKKWLKKHINNNEYFAKAIENILQGQKNKIYIIWNVEDKKLYLDNFLDDELIINRIYDKPQIYLNEEELNKGKIRIIIKTGESEHWIDYKKKSNKSKKSNYNSDGEDEDDDYEDDDYEDDENDKKKTKKGYFSFNLKRKGTSFFDKKLQNKLKKLDIDTSNFL
jgi:hypothetical protein